MGWIAERPEDRTRIGSRSPGSVSCVAFEISAAITLPVGIAAPHPLKPLKNQTNVELRPETKTYRVVRTPLRAHKRSLYLLGP